MKPCRNFFKTYIICNPISLTEQTDLEHKGAIKGSELAELWMSEPWSGGTVKTGTTKKHAMNLGSYVVPKSTYSSYQITKICSFPGDEVFIKLWLVKVFIKKVLHAAPVTVSNPKQIA